MTVTSPETQPGGAAPESAPVTARTSTVATVLVVAVPLAVACSILGMTLTGAFTANQQLVSAGDLVEYGLPVARVVHDTTAALTIGLLVVAAFALPAQKKDHGALSSVQHRAARWAAVSGAVWFLAAVVSIVFTGANTLGVPLTSPVFARNFMLFAFQVEIGQALVVSAAAILVATVVAAFATRVTTLAVATVAGLFALLPSPCPATPPGHSSTRTR
ncbi:hypothetical protein P9139_06675 [Curtobacterium flaccumfaciens]|nr:hypothetical protein P9139_06675 [Curtobacterium flaccumfaciens]